MESNASQPPAPAPGAQPTPPQGPSALPPTNGGLPPQTPPKKHLPFGMLLLVAVIVLVLFVLISYFLLF